MYRKKYLVVYSTCDEMKVTFDNIDNIPIHSRERKLLKSLLIDLKDINKHSKTILSIHWQDYHNEYSAERTDPCPDFYGTYTIRPENRDHIGIEMDINELDTSMCLLYNYIVNL